MKPFQKIVTAVNCHSSHAQVSNFHAIELKILRPSNHNLAIDLLDSFAFSNFDVIITKMLVKYF